MQDNNMKNIVVLKNIPSNIVEEAIVILKSKKYVKKFETIDKKNGISSTNNKSKEKDFVVKEAEMIISNYSSKVQEIGTKKKKITAEKYNKLHKYSVAVTVMFIFSLIINFIF